MRSGSAVARRPPADDAAMRDAFSRRDLLVGGVALAASATVAGARERQGPGARTPPPTDAGDLPNLKFSFAAAHTRVTSGGWARQVTVRELPVATTIAGVEMHLDPGAIRELHWHAAGGVGDHARRQRPRDRDRRPGPKLRRRRRHRRSVVLPHRAPALDPGPAGRLRVPAGLRRRRLLRVRHVPDLRLVRPHAAQRRGQELQPAGIDVRPPPERAGALHLPGQRCRARCAPTRSAHPPGRSRTA